MSWNFRDAEACILGPAMVNAICGCEFYPYKSIGKLHEP